MAMTLRDPNALERIRGHFDRAAFVSDVGIRLVDLAAGVAETELVVAARHEQSEGFVHAGVAATMADHTAGTAAGTLTAATDTVLTVEFKINLLRPMQGRRLHCRAEVLKSGKTLSVVEARVHCEQGEERVLVAAATFTMAIVRDPRG